MDMIVLLTWIDGLTKTLHGTVVFLLLSILMNRLYHYALTIVSTIDQVTPLSITLYSFISTMLWGITIILFTLFLLRTLFFSRFNLDG